MTLTEHLKQLPCVACVNEYYLVIKIHVWQSVATYPVKCTTIISGEFI